MSANTREHHTTLNHAFPLRPDTATHYASDAMLTIPRDLTSAEATRLGAWLKTLAVEWSAEPLTGPGPGMTRP